MTTVSLGMVCLEDLKGDKSVRLDLPESVRLSLQNYIFYGEPALVELKRIANPEVNPDGNLFDLVLYFDNPRETPSAA